MEWDEDIDIEMVEYGSTHGITREVLEDSRDSNAGKEGMWWSDSEGCVDEEEWMESDDDSDGYG